jgi:Flp pilus assembly pilin Flp
MATIFRKLWRDEVGAIIAAEYVIMATLLGIGIIVGVKCLRDAIITELADTAAAVSHLVPSAPNNIDFDVQPVGEREFVVGETIGDVIAGSNKKN